MLMDWPRSSPTSHCPHSGCDKPTGKTAGPKFLFPELGSIDPAATKAKSLEQLAALATHEDNGRFSRTIVNRIWHRLMGRGLVHPVDVMGNKPWSEDLLDYLAHYLIENKYDLKKLIEHIANIACLPIPGGFSQQGTERRWFGVSRSGTEANECRGIHRCDLDDNGDGTRQSHRAGGDPLLPDTHSERAAICSRKLSWMRMT